MLGCLDMKVIKGGNATGADVMISEKENILYIIWCEFFLLL